MDSRSAAMVTAGPPDPPRRRRGRGRPFAIALLVIVLIAALIAGLRYRSSADSVPSAAESTAGAAVSGPAVEAQPSARPPAAGESGSAAAAPGAGGVKTGTGWVPKPGVQWQWQLSSTPTAAQLATAYAAGARAFDIDGDAASAATVTAIHALGSDVGAVCYIDVGGWEDYRSDAANFPESVKGSPVDGWPSEKWLDVRQLAVLTPLMQARVQMCASKGFDAVEPDLLDGFSNDTGFPITAAEQITYNTMIAGLVHAAGMTVAQKGDVDQAAELEPVFDWTLNEQCGQYDECGALSAYTAAGKAIWIVEYSGFPDVCAIDYPVAGAAAMYKSLDLTDDPRSPCLSSTG
jgi:hypothetical protein